jgi:multidrug/microcin transport system ATP-binding/permease protein
MTIFLSMISRFRWLLLVTSLASVASAMAGIGLISAINERIAAPDLLNPHWNAMFAGLLLLLFVCSVGSQAVLTALGHKVVYEMRLVMLKRVLDTAIDRLEQIGDAALYAVLTKDVAAVGMAFNRLPFVLYNGVLVFGGLAYLGWLSWQLSLLTILVVVSGAMFAQSMMGRMRRLMKQVRETDDGLFAGYEGAIEGRCELALNSARKEQYFRRDFEPVAGRARRLEVLADRYWILSLNWGAVLILGLVGIIFAAGSALGIAPASVVAYVLVLMFLRMPLNDLVEGFPLLISGSVALEKIATLQLAPHREDFEVQPPAPPVAAGSVLLELEAVEYQYPHASDEYGFHLGPVDLTIKAGEILFIVGGNGSGKSTLARILTGLYQPSRGRIRLLGREIDDAATVWYRNHFSTVFSNFYLFERLVGPAGVLDQKLAQAFLARLKMERKVTLDDGRFSTTRLSQGQRKRLALLMAHMEDRPVMLLDEWAADQDPAFRAFFYEELLPELRRAGKTVIAISHDDRYFGVADRVLRCDSGVLQPLQSWAVASPPSPRRVDVPGNVHVSAHVS